MHDSARHQAVATLRRHGYSVIVFSPEDMPGDRATAEARFNAIARKIETACVARGNEVIDQADAESA